MGVGQADDLGRRWHGRPLQVAGSAVARSAAAGGAADDNDGTASLARRAREARQPRPRLAVEGARRGEAKVRRGHDVGVGTGEGIGAGRAANRGQQRGRGVRRSCTPRHGRGARAIRGGARRARVGAGGSRRGGATVAQWAGTAWARAAGRVRAAAAAAKLGSALLGRDREEERKRGAGPIGNEGSASHSSAELGTKIYGAEFPATSPTEPRSSAPASC
ncbi:uncharacterized protein [Miscanthus floridulus]|uniref:uncharacterized protein n=1 Tax=Miscanthus floridulus TaxID=154761 RepID=UPI0034582C66